MRGVQLCVQCRWCRIRLGGPANHTTATATATATTATRHATPVGLGMRERRPWEYPECDRGFDFGIHGVAPPDMFGRTRTPRRRRTAVLSPVVIDVVPRMEKPVNEFQLGVEVARMIDDETAAEHQRRQPWRSCVGIVRPEGFATAIMARPRSVPFDERIVRAEVSRDFAVVLEGVMPLEGSDGAVCPWPLGLIGLDHPVQSIACDYRSGGMVVLEDYAVSTYWPNEDHSLYLNMARQESLLTNHAAVSPFKRESVISFADGTLVHCDENFGIWHQMEGRPYDQVAWGNASNVFYSTAAHAMCVFDLRELTHESMVCESEARLQGLCAPHCDNNLIVTHNPDYLTIFDLRILPWPALRISRNLIGCDNFSWTGWLDRDRLAIYSTFPGAGQLYVVSDLHTGRPVVDCIRLERPTRGLSVDADGRLYCLFDDLTVMAWSIEELLDCETIGPIHFSPLAPEFRPPRETLAQDHLIVDVYEARELSEEAAWPSLAPLPKLSALSSAARCLTKYWPPLDQGE